MKGCHDDLQESKSSKAQRGWGKVRPGGLLRFRTLEGNKQKIQHSANA